MTTHAETLEAANAVLDSDSVPPAAAGKLRAVERVGYSLGDTASNLYWKTFEFFLLFFYTDVFGISAAAAGTMFGVTRIWDAINDPMMGLVADRTRTRFGRFRPYLIWMAIPLAVAGVLTFTTPNLGGTGKLVYAYVTYTFMMMAYTAINIPYSALMGVMTPNSRERTTLSTIRFLGAFVGALFVQKFTQNFVVWFGAGDEQLGWQLTMVLYGLIAIGLFVACFFTTRERVEPPKEQTANIRRELADLLRNKPWIVMVVLGLFVIVSFSIRGGVTIYYFKYYVNDSVLAGTFLASGTVAALAGIATTSFLNRFFSKRKLYSMLMGTAGLLTLAFYWIDASNITAMLVLNVVISLLLGPTAPLVWAMYADTADYSEWKTGRRATGLVFSAATLSMKLGGAVGGAATAGLLAWFGYVANAQQTQDALHGIVLCMSLIPGALGVLAAGIALLYPLNDELMSRIESELAERRA